MDVLKPKWVDNEDAKRNAGEDRESCERSIVFKKSTPDIFERQLPTLTTAYFYYDKKDFKPELQEIDPEIVHERYIQNNVIKKEQRILISKFDKNMAL